MPVLPIAVGSVRIRYLIESDFEPYVALEKDQDVKRYVGGASSRSATDLLISLRSYKPSVALLAVADSDSDAFLGRCGLLETDDGEAELHLVIATAHQKRGIATSVIPELVALATQMNLMPVSVVDPKNVGSLALMKRLGWVRDGSKQSDNYENGYLRFVPSGI